MSAEFPRFCLLTFLGVGRSVAATKRLLPLLAGSFIALLVAGCSGEAKPPTNIGATTATLRANATVDQGDNPVEWWFQLATSSTAIGPADPAGATTRCHGGPATIPPGTYNGIGCNVTGLTPNTNYFYKFCGDTPKINPTCLPGVQQFSTQGFIYWGGAADDTLGVARAGLDGNVADRAWIDGPGTAQAIAISNSHIYWANNPNGTIARANLDGTGITPNFIDPVGDVTALATNGTHIFWSSWGAGAGRIGRANIDGSGVNNNFIVASTGQLNDLTVDGSYVYWTNAGPCGGEPTGAAVVGRAAIGGGSITPCFVQFPSGGFPNVNDSRGIAVDNNYIYVALNSAERGSIGRAPKSGAGTSDSTFIHVGRDTWGVDITGSHIYWGEYGDGPTSIGRATIGGANVHHRFICQQGLGGAVLSGAPYGLAVTKGNGPIASTISPECLLADFSPQLRYDVQESYFADSAAAMVSNWGDEELGLWQYDPDGQAYSTVLWDGDGGVGNGALIAGAHPEIDWPFQLWLDDTGSSLGPTYPGGLQADSNDWLDVRDDYEEDAAALHAAGLNDHIYGHAVRDSNGRLWLQYWFFHYYNSFHWLGFGPHEGDWEMIQVLLDAALQPDQVVFAQHNGGARCTWGEVEKDELGNPIVYTALASHASYPHVGAYTVPGLAGHDHAPGNGEEVRPDVASVANGDPVWINWPGHWGNSRGTVDSPTGPAQHGQWSDPATFADEAIGCMDNFDPDESPYGRSARAQRARRASPRPPKLLNIARRRGQLRVIYRAMSRRTTRGRWPRMLLTVDAKGDDLPPRSIAVRNVSRGRFTFPFPVGRSERWIVRASVFTRDWSRSRVVSRPVPWPRIK